MLRQIKPRLGRTNVMFNSFSSCIANTPEKLSRTPEMSFSEIFPQPGMFSQKFKGAVTFKQLKCLTNRHLWRQFNKQVDMVNSDMNFVNFTSMINGNFMNESFAVNSQAIELERVHSIFNFPHEVESILPEGMLKMFQFHFFPPKSARRNIAHANFFDLVHGDSINPLDINKHKELNLVEEGNSSLCLKAEVSLPLM